MAAVRYARLWLLMALVAGALQVGRADESITADELAKVKATEAARIGVIDKVYGSVVAIYGNNRQGGGSGVLFDADGFALTNFHVVAGAGDEGWAGLADGKLYRWKLYGLDPGGDVAIIRLTGLPKFPTAELGDSRTVRVGDWAMAMGNPFVLAEDQKPTVTLGIVSAIQRFQPGAGKNSLVYGNCIQVDSSINPGNSGGPLFNMHAQVVGINGRGSFEERGRVNVGVGYAISVEQIKNFLPELFATKVAQHGTLDAVFTDRTGGVVCSQLNLDSKAAKAGLQLGDHLIAFAGEKIANSNHYLNLVSTLPAKWPVEVVFEHEGTPKSIWLRLDALPYGKPKAAPRPVPQPGQKPAEEPKPGEEPKPAEKQTDEPAAGDAKAAEKKFDEKQPDAGKPPAGKSDKQQPPKVAQPQAPLPPTEPGKIRDAKLNHEQAVRVLHHWKQDCSGDAKAFAALKDGLSFRASFDEKAFGEEESRSTNLIVTRSAGRFSADSAASTPPSPEAKAQDVVYRALAALYAPQPEESFAKLTLAGSDLAQGRRAYVLHGELASGDDFYMWFSVLSSHGEFRIELLKVAEDNDDRAAFTFHEFSPELGVQFPHRVVAVRGLSETNDRTIKLSEVALNHTDAAAKQEQSPDATSEKK